MKNATIINADLEVTVTLHKSDFTEDNWKFFKRSTDWFHTLFVGENIIRIFTWASNYHAIESMYNFNN